MKIVQKISLPENCVNCIERAAAAGVGFKCLALRARAALERINDEATGLYESEEMPSDITGPLIRQMVGAAAARSICTTSPPNALIKDTEKKMADCAGPLTEIVTHENKLLPTYRSAESLVFAVRDSVHDETTGEMTKAAARCDYGQDTSYTYDTSLLDPSKFAWLEFEQGGEKFKGIANIGGTTRAGDYHMAETLERAAYQIINALDPRN